MRKNSYEKSPVTFFAKKNPLPPNFGDVRIACPNTH
jgi:hypothetical protein